jgi:hypothetical protein
MANVVNNKNKKIQSVREAISKTPFGKVKVTQMKELFDTAKHHWGFDLTRVHGFIGAVRYINQSRINN